MKIYDVEWVDNKFVACGNWTCLEHLKEEKPSPCRTVGFLALESKDWIILVVSESGEFQAQGQLILKSCITKRECIKEVK